MTSLPTFLSSLTLVACMTAMGSQSAGAQDFNATPPNASGQEPAFENQTRAPISTDDTKLKRELIADGLRNPWGMDQLPDGRWIVTEKGGRMRIIDMNGTKSRPIGGLPEVDDRRQGGLLDVAVKDDFKTTRRVWWSFSEPRGNGTNATAVATGTLSEDETQMKNIAIVFQQQPAWRSTLHYGSRLVFDKNGALFITTGERSNPEPRQLAQDVGTHLGKVIRINPMGGAAKGNPQLPGGLPEIWSYGHRNMQAAALAPDGSLWTVEHGPKGGDELNRPEAGKNYGWPIITYGEDYSGAQIGKGETRRDGMEQPVYYWDPVIAPSGMAFYEGDMFSDWAGDILIGGLASQSLVRLELKNGKVAAEARYLQGENRIRDVDIAAEDGAIMILTDSQNGGLYRLTPQ